MYCKDKIPSLIAVIVIVCLIVSACSTSSIKFTQSELKIIPRESFRNILVPGEKVKIKTKEIETQMRVTDLKDNGYVVGTDEVGAKELKIAITEIKEIEEIKQTERAYTSGGECSANCVVESVFWSLFIPPALALYPLLYPLFYVLGINEEVNSKEREKADLIYRGMTKAQLRTRIGEPKQKYLCNYENWEFEVWNYNDRQVIRGGRFLFIDPKAETVSSTEPSFFPNLSGNNMPKCSLIPE